MVRRDQGIGAALDHDGGRVLSRAVNRTAWMPCRIRIEATRIAPARGAGHDVAPLDQIAVADRAIEREVGRAAGGRPRQEIESRPARRVVVDEVDAGGWRNPLPVPSCCRKVTARLRITAPDVGSVLAKLNPHR